MSARSRSIQPQMVGATTLHESRASHPQFAPGDLPFQVGDLILVRIIDPNMRRRELYKQKFGKTDPQMANYKEYTEDMVTYFPLEPEQEPLVQSALMMRENRSGYVRVLLGGSGSAESKYNRAIQAKRQAGSSFKPVIYAAALNKGFTPADIILDSPLQIPTGTGEVWRPKNYGRGFAGPVTFRNCLVKSRNIPTVKILQQIGTEQARAYARKLGYTCHLGNELAWALHNGGVAGRATRRICRVRESWIWNSQRVCEEDRGP